ncbi:hypothetical protein IW140_002970 [Coemansia sp. RSA 1813]|nr:hypothetical protein EV178_003826 [Coemansia sp. RSA 1646]KAJ1770602.1 hypothetical protein LPJ74_003051 [Coemansia sp. RSA 1843]KAJ2091400.1 hypothetical protein IW138_001859 [Coemansia sp. RSA 986]KAJ2212843.1 hypothetical protein EV179_004330 [Coemansia sp. RSA 487]KAJ2569562.1 hypothetical protein IW140_002970 [Coemansia sp. RSA 1813]
MFTISALSPPSTPRGPIFSPRQKGCNRWSVYALSLQSPGKRVKLDQPMAIKPTTTLGAANAKKLQFPQASTLASRRMKKAPPTPLMVAKAKAKTQPDSAGPATASVSSPMGSTGLSPIVKGLSLGRNGFGGSMVGSPLKINSLSNLNSKAKDDDKRPVSTSNNPFPLRKTKKPKPSGLQLTKQDTPAAAPMAPTALASPPTDNNTNSVTQPLPPPMTFRLQKTAPAKKQKKPVLGGKMSKLSVAPTGLISPPTTSTPLRKQPAGFSRPPALALGNAANTAMVGLPSAGLTLSPMSPSMPQTPGGSGFSGILSDCSAYGEVSPSFLAQRTPSPAAWAPTFFITPPTPQVPGTKIETSAAVGSADQSGSASLAPCTPPWPKSGSSLRKTIFDHIGQPQLSPMDLRGYMAISMNS